MRWLTIFILFLILMFNGLVETETKILRFTLKERNQTIERQRQEIVKLKYDLKQMAKYAESRQSLCLVKEKK